MAKCTPGRRTRRRSADGEALELAAHGLETMHPYRGQFCWLALSVRCSMLKENCVGGTSAHAPHRHIEVLRCQKLDVCNHPWAWLGCTATNTETPSNEQNCEQHTGSIVAC